MDTDTLFVLLIAGGIVCIAAAIVGGGLSLHVVSIPTMSLRRQVMLAIFGVVVASIGYLNLGTYESQEVSEAQATSTEQDPPGEEPVPPPADAPPK